MDINKRGRIVGSGPVEYWARETIADNFGMLVDPIDMLFMWEEELKMNVYQHDIRAFREAKDYWFDRFQRKKRKYDVARVLPEAFNSIRKTKEIKELIRRL